MQNAKVVEETVKRMVSEGRSEDEVITALRALGLTKMDCMIALEEFGDYSHVDAKLAVHRSKAWSDVRAVAEQLEDELLAELEKRGRRRPDGRIEL